MNLLERFRGCLLGLACGDAVGTRVEFAERGSFTPVTDMLGGGPFRLQPGQWTDDTSMALCLATSLVECSGFDALDQMRRYLAWYQHGYLSSTGACFDIGGATRSALERFEQSGEPFSGSSDPYSAGNGSIMRLAPVILYYYPDESLIRHYAGESSRTTHAALECIEACQLLGGVLYRILTGAEKERALLDENPGHYQAESIRAIARGEYLEYSESQISGSGYVVRSLEAALWCFWKTDSFEQAVLKAVNLGDDADTTAAVCGQVAGAYYGEGGIPVGWLDRLAMRAEITVLAEQVGVKQT